MYKAYRDTVGVWTIGVGHTAGVTEGDRCNEEQAMAWLAEDLQWSEAAVNLAKVPLTQHQFDALVSFTFNVGQFAFASSTLLRLLNEGNPPEVVARQFDRWNIPPEIISRRMGEKAQFLGTDMVARKAA
jgi:lysozyme